MIDKALYSAVMASRRWRDLRIRLIRHRGERCEHCQKTWAAGYRTSLQLHHRTYERLGAELDTDVELLCKACHESADKQRASEGRQRSASALYNARLDGWASKKYGDDWWWNGGDEIADEFDEWLEHRSDDDW